MDRSGKVNLDFIGRFETLEKDFELLTARLGVLASLPKTNTSPRGRDYRSYYDDESIEIVAKLYSRDIELFGYSFESK